MSQILVIFVSLFIYAECIENSEIIEGNNNFGYDLSNELYTDSSTNIWISPFCITSCFALIYPGSNGNTQTQIANIMGYPIDDDAIDITQQFFSLQSLIENTYDGTRDDQYDNKHSIIGIANKIYSSHSLTLKQTYIDALNNGQESFIEYNFDFTANNATTIINDWVSDNTNGLIDSIIDENEDISSWHLVAMNAIYLNGTFENQFEEHMTSLNTFYSDGLRTKEVTNCHLMHQMDYFKYYTNGDYQFLKFEFSDSSDLFVLFALPINKDLYSNKNGLITDESLIKTAINNLKSTYIALALPKVSIEATYGLKSPLIDLGITDAFTANADFSGISDTPLFIDAVIHKTMIEMDEKGLVAAAVTAIIFVRSAGPGTTRPTPILFKADHPYQMFIIDGKHDNAILFMGQINNPGIPKGSDTPTYQESSDPIWNNLEIYGGNSAISKFIMIPAICAIFILSFCL